MHAQDELKLLFRDIDHHTDLALAGLAKINRRPKLMTMPANHHIQRLGAAFIFAFVAFCALVVG